MSSPPWFFTLPTFLLIAYQMIASAGLPISLTSTCGVEGLMQSCVLAEPSAHYGTSHSGRSLHDQIDAHRYSYREQQTYGYETDLHETPSL